MMGFWIAQEVAHWKESHDAGKLFRESKRIAGKVPRTLITDGLGSYAVAFKQEFASASPSAKHIREIQLDGVFHNNNHDRL
jgi:hypothetical protein